MKSYTFREEEYAGEIPAEEADKDDETGDDQCEDRLFSRLFTHFEGKVAPFYAPDRNTALAASLGATGTRNSYFICTETSYVRKRAGAAIRDYANMKPLGIESRFGKLDTEMISCSIDNLRAEEIDRCSAISISQPTEYGLVYTPEEIADISGFAHENDMLLHMDGSRIFFAAAKIIKSFREQTSYAGVDIATFGGAKNGAGGGEAVLIFRENPADRFREILRTRDIDQSGAESFSKGLRRLLTHRLWRKAATNANEMAAILGSELSGIKGVSLLCEVETNKVIAEATPYLMQKLKENYSLKSFSCPNDTARFVTNYSTTTRDIKKLTDILR